MITNTSHSGYDNHTNIRIPSASMKIVTPGRVKVASGSNEMAPFDGILRTMSASQGTGQGSVHSTFVHCIALLCVVVSLVD